MQPDFLRPDDHVLLMDVWDNPIPLHDLRHFRDVGVKTALHFVPWYLIETAPGVLDWTMIDAWIENDKKAGLKTLLVNNGYVPEFFPEDWYMKAHSGTVFNSVAKTGWSILSWWNRDAQKASIDFTQRVINRYKSNPTVAHVPGLGKEGETLLVPFEDTWYDDAAIQSFTAWAMKRHKGDIKSFNRSNFTSYKVWSEVRAPNSTKTGFHAPKPPPNDTPRWLFDTLLPQVLAHHRLFAPVSWSNLHYAFSWESGNFLIKDVYKALGNGVCSIQFTHFPHGNLMWKAVLDSNMYDTKLYVGSEWTEGMIPHTPLAIEQGIQGFVTSPIHSYSGHKATEPWMFDTFKWCIGEFLKVRR